MRATKHHGNDINPSETSQICLCTVNVTIKSGRSLEQSLSFIAVATATQHILKMAANNTSAEAVTPDHHARGLPAETANIRPQSPRHL
jgi:hypothetical protein